MAALYLLKGIIDFGNSKTRGLFGRLLSAGLIFLALWALVALGLLASDGEEHREEAAVIAALATVGIMYIPLRNWYRLWKWRVKSPEEPPGLFERWKAKTPRQKFMIGGAAGAVVFLGGCILFTHWWYNPSVVPNGEFEIIESKGFGDTLKKAEVGTDGEFFGVRGPKFPIRKHNVQTTRRAFGADCLQDLGENGKVFWSYDPGVDMWKLQWDGLGIERTMLLKRTGDVTRLPRG